MLRFVRWERVFIASAIILAIYLINKFHYWKQTLLAGGYLLSATISLFLIYTFVLIPLWSVIKFFIRLPNDDLATVEKKQSDFYSTREWKELRYIILSNNPKKCMLCGRRGKSLHVDHIKPRSIYPELELDINNLQILCGECNLGKSNRFTHDFRPVKC